MRPSSSTPENTNSASTTGREIKHEAEGGFVETIRQMLARPDYLIPLAAAERQYRDHYYGLNAAALLEDLFCDALGNFSFSGQATRRFCTSACRPKRMGLQVQWVKNLPQGERKNWPYRRNLGRDKERRHHMELRRANHLRTREQPTSDTHHSRAPRGPTYRVPSSVKPSQTFQDRRTHNSYRSVAGTRIWRNLGRHTHKPRRHRRYDLTLQHIMAHRCRRSGG